MTATVITVAGPKGGCSKSTTAWNLAVSLTNMDFKVALLDTDPEVQAILVHDIRKQDPDLPQFHFEKTTGDVSRTIKSLAADVFDFVVVDTPGIDSIEGKYAVALSQVALYPFKNSIFDKATLPRCNRYIEEVRINNRDIAALIFAADTMAGISGQTRRRTAATQLAPLTQLKMMDRFTTHRYAYVDSLEEGKGVVEWSDPTAVQEFRAFTLEVLRHAEA